jgi:stringent starvation protein B
MAETSTKPYLIRAIHEWCADNGFTPYLAVAVDSRTMVPREFVRNGEIVLNVSMSATHHLKLGNELIEFQARFGGVARELSIPVENVSAIYARENGHGMAFDVPKAPAITEADAPVDAQRADASSDAPGASAPAPSRGPRGVPQLVSADGAAPGEAGTVGEAPPRKAADDSAPDSPPDTPPDTPPEPPPGPTPDGPRRARPKLTRIK